MKIFLFVSIILLILQGTARAYESTLKEIQVIDNGEYKTLWTRARTVEDILEINNIVLHEQDIINLSLDHKILDDEVIIIDRSFNVNVIAGYKQMSVKLSPGKKVYDLINIVSERTGNKYIHNGYLDEELTQNQFITLIHLKEEYVDIKEPINFKTEVIYNNNIPYGVENILTHGESGLKSIYTLITFENGKEVTREIIQETIISYPVNQVKEIGTKRTVATSTGNFQYLDSFMVEATAYSPQQPNLSNYTATGIRATRGVVAVDPSVIPLGTNLYIPGYGHAVAADTGGAIRGKKIDLCFDNIQESIEFGRRNIKVYILK